MNVNDTKPLDKYGNNGPYKDHDLERNEEKTLRVGIITCSSKLSPKSRMEKVEAGDAGVQSPEDMSDRKVINKLKRNSAKVAAQDSNYDFDHIKMRNEEDIMLYMYRVENAYRRKYPQNEVSTSQLLLRKFLHTCPKKVEKYIQKCRDIKRNHGHELKWKHMPKMLKVYLEDNLDSDASSSD